MSAQSVKKAKRQRVGTTLETKLKLNAEFEAGKRAGRVGRELGISATAVRTIVADKQKYKIGMEETTEGGQGPSRAVVPWNKVQMFKK
jgi:hypothetical protein